MLSQTQLAGHAIILYDGVCGLCNRFVRFVLRRDNRGYFLFVALQDSLAIAFLERHSMAGQQIDSVCLVVEPNTNHEKFYIRSAAVVEILRELGGLWGVCSALLGHVPRGLRDFGYGVVARLRYRVFGRYEVCPLPLREDRDRFLISEEAADE